jgi:dihydroxyacetone kinase-like predicted kinase
MMEVLDPKAYVSAMAAAATVLEAHAGALDLLDRGAAPAGEGPVEGASGFSSGSLVSMTSGGTGTDLAATLSASVTAAGSCKDFASACDAMTGAAAVTAGSRGGRALAAFLSGLGEVFANADRIDATRFALGMEAAAERLAPRDDGRHPGGFAAVANAAADAALDSADRGSELGEAILAAASAGIEELERGPVLDARLASKGTVDSAAAGLLLVLDALASVVTGEPLPEPPDAGSGGVLVDSVGSTTRYEVQCQLLADDPGVEAEADLEVGLSGLCDSFRMDRMRDQGWALAIQTASPGVVVELLAGLGVMREVRIAVRASDLARTPGESLVGAGG